MITATVRNGKTRDIRIEEEGKLYTFIIDTTDFIAGTCSSVDEIVCVCLCLYLSL